MALLDVEDEICSGALKYGLQKSVTRKMACAPWEMVVSVEGLSRSASTISMPWEARVRAVGLEALRVMPRMLQLGEVRNLAATEPPCVGG